MSDMMKLTCETCGTVYEKPAIFQKYLAETNSVTYKWMMRFCDKCRRKKTLEALQHLPEILNAIATK
jgi:hypothetical protein